VIASEPVVVLCGDDPRNFRERKAIRPAQMPVIAAHQADASLGLKKSRLRIAPGFALRNQGAL
jgi:hypothetical protein